MKKEEKKKSTPRNEEKETPKSNKVLLIVVIILLVICSIFILNKNRIINYLTKNNIKEVDKKPESIEVIETEKEYFKNDYKITKNSLDNFDLVFLKMENEEKNMIYSPLSIKYALGMLMTGASGETKTQINEVLGNYKFHKFDNNQNMSFANAMFIKNSYRESIKKSYVDALTKNFGATVRYDTFKSNNLINSYVSEKTFDLVNGIVDNVDNYDYLLLNALAINMNWVHRIQTDFGENESSLFGDDEKFSVSFAHLDYYKSVGILNEVDYHKLSFNDDKVKRQSVEIGAVVNNYDIVKILGKDKIKKIVMDDYNKWVNEGAPGSCNCDYDEDTGEEICKPDKFDFNEYLKELDINHGYAEGSTDFEFYIDDNVKVFKKKLRKYGNTTLQYVGIMPTKVKLKDYVKNVSEADINTLIKSTKGIKSKNFKDGVITEITGYIPLFNFDYELKLKDDLNKLGITDVFDSTKADLSNLTNSKSYINDAIHKAQIEFSNDGIKAAALTALGGYGGGDCGWDYNFKPPVEKIDLTFDKPFLFLIMDKDTEEVWFMGRVYEPDEYKSYDETFQEKYPNFWDNVYEDDYEDEDEY